MSQKPNILLILCDDLGYSDLGCYGGEVDTPNIDGLASNGIRFTQFYNSPRCAPSRASLMTGLYPHQTGIGILTYDDGPDGYPGNLNKQGVTIAEVLKEHDYRTYLAGKWHLTNDSVNVNDTWPLQRGFDRFYGTITGSGSFFHPHTLTRDNESIDHEVYQDDFYYTDAISTEAEKFIREHVKDYPDKPFFQYVAYTAPHWPLHAREEDIQKYKGRFDKGWDQLREERMERLIDMGIIDESWRLSGRDPNIPEWNDLEEKEWYLRCMEVYAAQIDRMDQGVGRIIRSLEETGQLDNTLIFFLSDNGGCAEIIEPHPELGTKLLNITHTREGKPILLGNHTNVMPGAEDTFQTYSHWANLSNTPFRYYKSWVHEGGIASPFIVHWPKGIQETNSLRHSPSQLIDIMATVLDVTGANYPDTYRGHKILPYEGKSLVPKFSTDKNDARLICWEHQGNCAIRYENWKLVKKFEEDWELYDMIKDRTETNNVSRSHPDITEFLKHEYEKWAKRCHVIPREKILNIPGRTTHPNPYFKWMI